MNRFLLSLCLAAASYYIHFINDGMASQELRPLSTLEKKEMTGAAAQFKLPDGFRQAASEMDDDTFRTFIGQLKSGIRNEFYEVMTGECLGENEPPVVSRVKALLEHGDTSRGKNITFYRGGETHALCTRYPIVSELKWGKHSPEDRIEDKLEISDHFGIITKEFIDELEERGLLEDYARKNKIQAGEQNTFYVQGGSYAEFEEALRTGEPIKLSRNCALIDALRAGAPIKAGSFTSEDKYKVFIKAIIRFKLETGDIGLNILQVSKKVPNMAEEVARIEVQQRKIAELVQKRLNKKFGVTGNRNILPLDSLMLFGRSQTETHHKCAKIAAGSLKVVTEYVDPIFHTLNALQLLCADPNADMLPKTKWLLRIAVLLYDIGKLDILTFGVVTRGHEEKGAQRVKGALDDMAAGFKDDECALIKTLVATHTAFGIVHDRNSSEMFRISYDRVREALNALTVPPELEGKLSRQALYLLHMMVYRADSLSIPGVSQLAPLNNWQDFIRLMFNVCVEYSYNDFLYAQNEQMRQDLTAIGIRENNAAPFFYALASAGDYPGVFVHRQGESFNFEQAIRTISELPGVDAGKESLNRIRIHRYIVIDDFGAEPLPADKPPQFLFEFLSGTDDKCQTTVKELTGELHEAFYEVLKEKGVLEKFRERYEAGRISAADRKDIYDKENADRRYAYDYERFGAGRDIRNEIFHVGKILNLGPDSTHLMGFLDGLKALKTSDVRDMEKFKGFVAAIIDGYNMQPLKLPPEQWEELRDNCSKIKPWLSFYLGLKEYEKRFTGRQFENFWDMFFNCELRERNFRDPASYEKFMDFLFRLKFEMGEISDIYFGNTPEEKKRTRKEIAVEVQRRLDAAYNKKYNADAGKWHILPLQMLELYGAPMPAIYWFADRDKYITHVSDPLHHTLKVVSILSTVGLTNQKCMRLAILLYELNPTEIDNVLADWGISDYLTSEEKILIRALAGHRHDFLSIEHGTKMPDPDAVVRKLAPLTDYIDRWGFARMIRRLTAASFFGIPVYYRGGIRGGELSTEAIRTRIAKDIIPVLIKEHGIFISQALVDDYDHATWRIHPLSINWWLKGLGKERRCALFEMMGEELANVHLHLEDFKKKVLWYLEESRYDLPERLYADFDKFLENIFNKVFNCQMLELPSFSEVITQRKKSIFEETLEEHLASYALDADMEEFIGDLNHKIGEVISGILKSEIGDGCLKEIGSVKRKTYGPKLDIDFDFCWISSNPNIISIIGNKIDKIRGLINSALGKHEMSSNFKVFFSRKKYVQYTHIGFESVDVDRPGAKDATHIRINSINPQGRETEVVDVGITAEGDAAWHKYNEIFFEELKGLSDEKKEAYLKNVRMMRDFVRSFLVVPKKDARHGILREMHHGIPKDAHHCLSRSIVIEQLIMQHGWTFEGAMRWIYEVSFDENGNKMKSYEQAKEGLFVGDPRNRNRNLLERYFKDENTGEWYAVEGFGEDEWAAIARASERFINCAKRKASWTLDSLASRPTIRATVYPVIRDALSQNRKADLAGAAAILRPLAAGEGPLGSGSKPQRSLGINLQHERFGNLRPRAAGERKSQIAVAHTRRSQAQEVRWDKVNEEDIMIVKGSQRSHWVTTAKVAGEGIERPCLITTARVHYNRGTYFAKWVDRADSEKKFILPQARHAAQLAGLRGICQPRHFLKVISPGAPRHVILFQDLNSGEYKGEDLYKKYEPDRPTTPDTALWITLAIARIVRQLHERGLYHLDIKPGNVWLSEKREVILFDFDLMVASMEEFEERELEGFYTGFFSSLTRRSNELHISRNLAAEDIYSIGATLAFLLDVDTPAHLLDYIYKCNEPDKHKKCFDNFKKYVIVPECIQPIIVKIAKGQYKAIDELIADLEGALDKVRNPPMPVTPSSKLHINPPLMSSVLRPRAAGEKEKDEKEIVKEIKWILSLAVLRENNNKTRQVKTKLKISRRSFGMYVSHKGRRNNLNQEEWQKLFKTTIERALSEIGTGVFKIVEKLAILNGKETKEIFYRNLLLSRVNVIGVSGKRGFPNACIDKDNINNLCKIKGMLCRLAVKDRKITRSAAAGELEIDVSDFTKYLNYLKEDVPDRWRNLFFKKGRILTMEELDEIIYRVALTEIEPYEVEVAADLLDISVSSVYRHKAAMSNMKAGKMLPERTRRWLELIFNYREPIPPPRELDLDKKVVSYIKWIEDTELKQLRRVDFKLKTDNLIQALAGKAVSLDEVLPEAFALFKNAASRCTRLDLTDEQILAAISIHRGRAVELDTGKGKTLAIAMAAYLNALIGKGIHIEVFNDYLSRRDAEQMSAIFDFLGLTTGLIMQKETYVFQDGNKTLLDGDRERHRAYECDITYGEKEEFMFDYLKDNKNLDYEKLRQREVFPGMVIVDDARPTLVDEAYYPLIEAMPDGTGSGFPGYVYEKIYGFVRDELVRGEDYDVDVHDEEIILKEEAAGKKIKKFFEDYVKNFSKKLEGLCNRESGLKDLYENRQAGSDRHMTMRLENLRRRITHLSVLITNLCDKKKHLIRQALKAMYFYNNGKDYIKVEVETDDKTGPHGKIVIVDNFTGRLKDQHTWVDGIQQFVEAKEGVPISKYVSLGGIITHQCYHKMMQEGGSKLAAVSGAIGEDGASEFRKIYGLDPVRIPVAASKRIVEPDMIFNTPEEKKEAIIKYIKTTHEDGNPILVFTDSIEEANDLSGQLNAWLKERNGHECGVIDGKDSKKAEVEIISKAGECYAITVATNAAIVGTDIEITPSARERGGMVEVRTSKGPIRCIEEQKEGRVARIDNPGRVVTFLCVHDMLFRRFYRPGPGARIEDMARLAQIQGEKWYRRLRRMTYYFDRELNGPGGKARIFYKRRKEFLMAPHINGERKRRKLRQIDSLWCAFLNELEDIKYKPEDERRRVSRFKIYKQKCKTAFDALMLEVERKISGAGQCSAPQTVSATNSAEYSALSSSVLRALAAGESESQTAKAGSLGSGSKLQRSLGINLPLARKPRL